MIKTLRFFLALSFTTFLSLSTFAQAPVVDDSENFAILDEPQIIEQSAAQTPGDMGSDEEERPLARDSSYSGSHNDNASLLEKLQGLQQEMQELRGQIEVQAHEIKTLQQQQLAFYKDLDARIQQHGSASSPTAELKKEPTDLSVAAAVKPVEPTGQLKPAVTIPARGNPADEQVSYLAAYELIKNKKYDDALNAMQTFVAQYPQGGYTANAQYWLGELFMVKKDYSDAIEHFETVLQKFPSSSKAAASMLKIGYALAAQGKTEEAKTRLEQVVKNYPDTNTAQLATTKLQTLI